MNPHHIRELRILPPFAIARQGSAPTPADNYVLEDDPAEPLGFRKVRPAETLVVDDSTGEITGSFVPEKVTFKQNGKFRPVAPFLEVFAVTADDRLVPLTPELLEANGLKVSDVQWRVQVANTKVERRTGSPSDAVKADSGWFGGHDARILEGHCPNFVADRYVDFGRARFIRPNAAFPGLRLRFTPATGLIYGPKVPVVHPTKEYPDIWVPPPELRIYDNTKKGAKWAGFEVPVAIDNEDFPAHGKFWNETLPPSLFAIEPPAPPWLHGNAAKSRGYIDDACDGIVEVRIRPKHGDELSAAARVTSGPPTVVVDSLFVRTLADDLDQVLHGPGVPSDEAPEVTRARAEDIVRRAMETVRFLNVEVMNGNDVQGRPAMAFDTMPYEEASDTERPGRPIMSPDTADSAAVLAIHQRVYAAIRAGAAPWFTRLLRRPEEATDYTDTGRRKMPALMIGGDNNYLALTYRMIETIVKAGRDLPFEDAADPKAAQRAQRTPALTPRNLSAQLHYVAAGNPVNSRVEMAISNCCPGLEVDFRAVWRRMFTGIVLREYDNLVVEVEPGVAATKDLRYHRLLRIAGIPTMAQMKGPSTLDLNQSVVVATESNPEGLSPLEWSNSLAHILWNNAGKKVVCDFSPEKAPYVPVAFDKDTCISIELEVRHFFEPNTVVIDRKLAKPGELTQGLCSPWQNDYRECSCYYWASARPDFVNVEVTPSGRSAGDNWMQIERTGEYVADDYADTRLIDYDHLFRDWERWLRVQVCGRDSPENSP